MFNRVYSACFIFCEYSVRAMACVQRRLTSLQHEFFCEFGIRCWHNDRLMQHNWRSGSKIS